MRTEHASDWLETVPRCPRDVSRLELHGNFLVCEQGHRYPVVGDVPVLVRDDVRQTLWVAQRSWELAMEACSTDGPPKDPLFLDALGVNDQQRAEIRSLFDGHAAGVDPVVQYIVAATSGVLYRPLLGRLSAYPIPEIRLPTSSGEKLLDIGCNWGRWSVAASRKGYDVTGLDPTLGAIFAAKRVCGDLGATARFVCGDGRFLPFADNTFDVVFSFGVLQHLSKADVRQAVSEIARVLKPGGKSLVQMPNAFGVRSIYQQARRRFRQARDFDVRYWSPEELDRTFGAIGPCEMTVDGYFGLGIQAQDAPLLPPHYRAVVQASEALRSLSKSQRWMRMFADSLYIESQRPA